MGCQWTLQWRVSSYREVVKLMGRGRAKGRKLTVISHEDIETGGEEPLPANRRRGRPHKQVKDDIDEEEADKVEEEDGIGKLAKSSNEVKVLENSGKRNRYSQVKENSDTMMEENGAAVRSNNEESTKMNGFRQNGSRRKSKPRRAAEAGVECR